MAIGLRRCGSGGTTPIIKVSTQSDSNYVAIKQINIYLSGHNYKKYKYKIAYGPEQEVEITAGMSSISIDNASSSSAMYVHVY